MTLVSMGERTIEPFFWVVGIPPRFGNNHFQPSGGYLCPTNEKAWPITRRARLFMKILSIREQRIQQPGIQLLPIRQSHPSN